MRLCAEEFKPGLCAHPQIVNADDGEGQLKTAQAKGG